MRRAQYGMERQAVVETPSRELQPHAAREHVRMLAESASDDEGDNRPVFHASADRGRVPDILVHREGDGDAGRRHEGEAEAQGLREGLILASEACAQ